MKRLAPIGVACALLAATPARAEVDARVALFPDSAVVASVRPLALGAALRRLGSGWEATTRRGLSLPATASPFDAQAFTTLGVDPAALSWAGLRALRGGLHLRAAIPLGDAKSADALLQAAAGALGATLSRGERGEWGGRAPRGEPILARLDGQTLIVDLVLPGPTAAPTPADVARIIPLKPPRAWRGDRGIARRMGPSDGLAVWSDLALLPQLAFLRAEAQVTQALKQVAPADRATISRQARTELATCRMAINAAVASFDDARLALVVRGPDELALELALGGKKAAVDKLRALSTQAPTRALEDEEASAELRLRLLAPLPVMLAPARPGPARAALPDVCPDAARLALLLRSWPTLRDAEPPGWMQLLAQLRAGVVLFIPTGTEPRAGVSPRELVAIGELEPAARGLVDRLLGKTFSPVTPLHAGSRQLSAWATRGGAAEGPVVVVDPGTDGAAAGTLVGVGGRELLKTRFEHLGTKPPTAGAALASATLTARGIARLLRQLRAGELAAMLDGITRVEAQLLLEPELIRLEASLALGGP